MTQHQEELARIIKGIAIKSAYKVFSRTAEDIEQDLWVYVLEKELNKGRELEGNLVAKICYDRILDMIDYDQRRNTFSYEDFANQNNDEDTGKLHSSFISNKKYEDMIMTKELFRLFPEGSKERTFLEFWGTYVNLIDGNYDTHGPSRQENPENQLAKYLGYAGSGSNGYRGFRNKMRNFIKEYMDL